MNRRIINTNIRLNLEQEEDRRAWEYLQGMDRKQYKSYTRAVVAAIKCTTSHVTSFLCGSCFVGHLEGAGFVNNFWLICFCHIRTPILPCGQHQLEQTSYQRIILSRDQRLLA
mgnify:CR=1 FL=1